MAFAIFCLKTKKETYVSFLFWFFVASRSQNLTRQVVFLSLYLNFTTFKVTNATFLLVIYKKLRGRPGPTWFPPEKRALSYKLRPHEKARHKGRALSV